MKKYKVYGTAIVSVTKEVWANNEDEAREKAYDRLCCLTSYCGNGGYDKLVGVEEDDETVDVFEDITYDEVEEIDEDPDYFECPECEEECDVLEDENGNKYFCCVNCGTYYDDNGNEFGPAEEE